MHSYVLFFFMPTAFNFSSVKQSTTINAMSWFVHGYKWQLWQTGFRILRQIKHFLWVVKPYLTERKLLYHTPHQHAGIPSGTWRFYQSLWRVAWSSAPNCQCTMLCNDENSNKSYSRVDHQTSFEKFLFLMNFYSNLQISFIFQGLDIVKLNNKKNLLLTFIHQIKNYEPVVYENRDTSL